MEKQEENVATDHLRFVKLDDGVLWPCLVFLSADEMQRVLRSRRLSGLNPDALLLTAINMERENDNFDLLEPMGIMLRLSIEDHCVEFFGNAGRVFESADGDLAKAVKHAKKIIRDVLKVDGLGVVSDAESWPLPEPYEDPETIEAVRTHEDEDVTLSSLLRPEPDARQQIEEEGKTKTQSSGSAANVQPKQSFRRRN